MISRLAVALAALSSVVLPAAIARANRFDEMRSMALDVEKGMATGTIVVGRDVEAFGRLGSLRSALRRAVPARVPARAATFPRLANFQAMNAQVSGEQFTGANGAHGAGGMMGPRLGVLALRDIAAARAKLRMDIKPTRFLRAAPARTAKAPSTPFGRRRSARIAQAGGPKPSRAPSAVPRARQAGAAHR